MRDSFVFGMLAKNRGRLLQLVEGCPEDKRNVVPEGFNNSVHWQIGHVLTVTERLVFGLAEQAPVLSADYQTFFGNGTKPADWQEEPPGWDLLMAQLKEQSNRICESLKDKLEVSVKENFLKAESVGELIVSSVLHEVNHAGTISAMLKVLK
ncbi:DinB superfamily protein [Paenibacillus sp. yr247]|uniref:DinB family protein n=1 Tax=Paenibacillus sp. yr247 TaxID=1761880 RepID=UPI0008853579|nr:DinB family protein [Paenibacillus sp. yr247]SDM78673.1 DinB superfamily protein [Paenibacillus sp. yr247]